MDDGLLVVQQHGSVHNDDIALHRPKLDTRDEGAGNTSFNETHSAHNICKVMKRMRLKYGLPPRTASEQVFDTEEEMWEAEHRYDRPCITTDLGADISAGVERDERWDWNRCICHCLNLAMTAACKVEAVASILHEMRSLASRLKRSPAEWSKFKELQWE